MKRALVAAACILCTSAALPAQQNILYNDGPNPASPSGNAFPWGSEGIRYQMIVPQSVLGATPGWINDLFVVGRTTDTSIFYGDIEIRMGVTKATPASFSANWTTNNPKPTTVFRGRLRVDFVVNKWMPIGLPSSYLWRPTSPQDNLCLEVIVWKVLDKGNSSTSANFYFPAVASNSGRAFRYQWTTNQTQTPLTSNTSGGSRLGIVFNDGNFVAVGESCKGSNGPLSIGAKTGTWPQVNKPFTLTLSGGAKGKPAFVFYGIDNQKLLNVLPLPFDLLPLGAPGCFVWNEPLFQAATTTDQNGDASVVVFVPSTFRNLRLYAHWWVLDVGANQFGYTTSDSGLMIWGS